MYQKVIKNQKYYRTGLQHNITEPEETLLPLYILMPLWLIALTLPNLIYSGVYWYETLHLTKWVVCGASVAFAGAIAGYRLMYYGDKKLAFKIDGFAVLWIILLVYLMIQPIWTDIRSISSFVQEAFCFAAVVGFYIISLNSFSLKVTRPLIWLANINGAVNVLFAEIQTRHWVEGNTGWWKIYNEILGDTLHIILPTPGNYIGNTGQQNMFGLWLAICVMNSIYLYVAYAILPSGKKRSWQVTLLNIFFLLVNCWGLLASTSRSAILSLGTGLFMLIIMFSCLKTDKAFIKRVFHAVAVLLITAAAIFLFNPERAEINIGKTLDMLQKPETLGGRIGIWATSWAMFKMYPVKGVGLGQYKWHYLDAQRRMFDSNPDASWQYTHWAHNEFLQWFCEAGVIGGIILVLMLLWWFISVVAAIIKKKETSSEAIWANALIVLLLFNAVWTRPFHRIENILWLSFAFALANREMLIKIPQIHFSKGKEFLAKLLGVSIMLTSIAGLYFLADGMYGDRMLRNALSTNDAATQRGLLEKAQEHMMVKLEAEKQLAYHYISYAESIRSERDLVEGLERMLQYFKKEPHSQELSVLFEWAQKFQDVSILRYLVGFLKPGTFEFTEPPAAVPNTSHDIP